MVFGTSKNPFFILENRNFVHSFIRHYFEKLVLVSFLYLKCTYSKYRITHEFEYVTHEYVTHEFRENWGFLGQNTDKNSEQTPGKHWEIEQWYKQHAFFYKNNTSEKKNLKKIWEFRFWQGGPYDRFPIYGPKRAKNHIFLRFWLFEIPAALKWYFRVIHFNWKG